MNAHRTITAALLALTAAGAWSQTPAPAEPATPRVDQRQSNQAQRIDQGVASGALTLREAVRLEREQNFVARAEAHAKADGSVTRQERRRLHLIQDGASRDIARQKHDLRVAVPRTGN